MMELRVEFLRRWTRRFGLLSVVCFPLLFLPMLRSNWTTHWFSALPIVFSVVTVFLLLVLWWVDR